ncbi:MAG: DUF192 domain-containing protein [Puniceicoccales bacterium]|nr:DUF192 domain-containing protein [Puniceicoccales bacterium]
MADFSERFPITLGGKVINVQIALTELETTGGLMHRTTLAPDEGMLFVFAELNRRNFWMHNVPINLSLGYFTKDGRLDEIKMLFAKDQENVPSRSGAVRFVLELREGWFAENKIGRGAQLDIAAIRKAVRARGFDPEHYGL